MTLSQRYRFGRPRILGLSFHQLVQIFRLNRKLRDGVYGLQSVPCCICGDADGEVISERDRHGVRSRVIVCRGCGLTRTNPLPTRDTLASYYAEEYYALEYGQREPASAFFRSQYERGREIHGYLKRVSALPSPGGRVLEIGCSSGGILQYFREQGYQVHGVDLSESFTTYGREQFGLELKVGTVGDVSPDWAPDLVIYSHTLEHVASPNEELSCVRDLLVDQGLFYVQVPGIKDLYDGYRNDFLAYIQFAHIHHFSLRTLTNLLEKNGFHLFAGDECVNAVFTKTSSQARPPENDFEDVIRHLNRTERERPPLLSKITHAVWQRLRAAVRR